MGESERVLKKFIFLSILDFIKKSHTSAEIFPPLLWINRRVMSKTVLDRFQETKTRVSQGQYVMISTAISSTSMNGIVAL